LIGIIGAMEEEVSEIKDCLEPSTLSISEKAGMVFYSGTLLGQEVTVVRSGVGKVNSALCSQVLIDDFYVKALINTGIAGSLDRDIDIGDIVISKDVIHHDMDASIFGDPKGWVPRMDTLSFPADEELIKTAETASDIIGIRSFIGRVATGDQFVASKATKERIVSEFGAICTEMEGAGIGQAAYINRVPYVIIRAISDKADDSANMDYAEFESHAIANSVKLICKMMELI
jgi:adenosylhomocysteine nucleosidase